MADRVSAEIQVNVPVDGHDIVDALNSNDEFVLAFIIQMLEKAESSELRERLAARLVSWDEDREFSR